MGADAGGRRGQPQPGSGSRGAGRGWSQESLAGGRGQGDSPTRWRQTLEEQIEDDT